ncbi:hypothetical protein QOZ80_3AG0250430 [Eleusine coracana subsp. coracana]|nr:hypothetical protein QOZ80_3AG0250430 [Eleusine coracana subsp. coracana]
MFWDAVLPTSTGLNTVDELCNAIPSMYLNWPPKLRNTLLLCLLWVVWKRRNKKIFDAVAMSLPAVASMLQEHLRLWVVRAPTKVDTQQMEYLCTLNVDVIR